MQLESMDAFEQDYSKSLTQAASHMKDFLHITGWYGFAGGGAMTPVRGVKVCGLQGWPMSGTLLQTSAR